MAYGVGDFLGGWSRPARASEVIDLEVAWAGILACRHLYRERTGVKYEDDGVPALAEHNTGLDSQFRGYPVQDPAREGPAIRKTAGSACLLLCSRRGTCQASSQSLGRSLDEVTSNSTTGATRGSRRARGLFNQFAGKPRIEGPKSAPVGRSIKCRPSFISPRPRKGYSGGSTASAPCPTSGTPWFEDEGKPIKNCASCCPSWTRKRSRGVAAAGVTAGDVRKADSDHAPEVWRKVMKGKIERRQVWSSKVRSKQQQVPVAGSDDEKILDEVAVLTPAEFEAFTVALIDKLPDSCGLEHRVTRTRRTGDHGITSLACSRCPIRSITRSSSWARPSATRRLSRRIRYPDSSRD